MKERLELILFGLSEEVTKLSKIIMNHDDFM